MKKLISIDDLKSGMFLEADVVDEVVDGETVSFLGARNSVSKGTKGKRAKLTGRMNTRVQRDGGVRIASDAQVSSLKSTGLSMITTAALLHDVGKTRVPLEILNKPGRFEPHELEEMRKHVVYSGEILTDVGGFPAEALPSRPNTTK